MAAVQMLVLLTSAVIASGQLRLRPSFAGSRPIGFPELVNKTTTPSGLEDKFGEGTTQRLPIEAQGDRELLDQLSKLPIDKQPFWFINWQALQAQREKPQTYPQKPNLFIESNFQNTNSVPQNQNRNPGNSNFNPGFLNSNTGIASTIPGNTGNSNSGSGVQIPNWRVQDPLSTNNSNSNVNNRYGTETSTAGSTSTDINTNIFNARVDNNNPKPVTSNIDVKKEVLADPGLTPPTLDVKKAEGSAVGQENEFEDIEVKKSVKNK